jgi:peptidoglycan/xylan/chitin deacetylase (PgdA/CDA1 family)
MRKVAKMLCRRVMTVKADPPVISFTFDDFPRSALVGGDILSRHGFAGTFYVALSLAGKEGGPGQMFEMEDLPLVVQQGHELGCHTFGHCHSWETTAEKYESSVVENSRKLKEALPDVEFRSFSYPYCSPHPMNKCRVAPHFLSCRAGEQGINTGPTDLNQLDAFFLEKTRGDVQPVREIIDLNCRRNGWLIFATHDISDSPSPFGCTPSFFEEVVKYAAESGARILPISEGVEALRAANSSAQ